MTTIETSCDRCGPVETTPRRVALRLGGPAASYRFRCPECHRLVRRTADDTTVLLLVRAGVRPRRLARLRWGRAYPGTPDGASTFASAHQPRQPLRCEPAVTGPVRTTEPGPITWDDVVEFALRLGVEPAPAAAAATAAAMPATLGPSLAGQPAA